MKDSSSPADPQTDLQLDPQIDPRLADALERLEIEPGPRVHERTLRGDTAGILAAWDAFEARVEERAARPSRGTTHVRREISARLRWVGISAAVLCVVGLSAILMYRTGSKTHTTQYQTAAGQMSRVALPGGTVMTLAPATSVAVSGTRGAATVDVVGEAYFSVATSSKSPFVVRTNNSVVQVLGTAFSVRRYANETHTRVVVEDGKVAVRARRAGIIGDAPMTMTARMMAQVSDSGVSVTPVRDTRALTGWRDGRLVFDNAPVRDVVAEIARCYNAVIRVEGNDLANQTLVLDVAIHRRSLDQVLYMVSLATDAHVRRDGDAFVLVPGRDVATPRERKPQTIQQPEKLYGR